MRKSLAEEMEELNAALAELKAMLWADRWVLGSVIGTLGLVVWACVFLVSGPLT